MGLGSRANECVVRERLEPKAGGAAQPMCCLLLFQFVSEGEEQRVHVAVLERGVDGLCW